MPRSRPSRAAICRLVASGLACALVLTACSSGGGQAQGTSQAGKTTAGVTLDDLKTMLPGLGDIPSDLTGFTVKVQADIPNAVKANTGGTAEPVEPDDPKLAEIEGWGRLGGAHVEFTREAAGDEPTSIDFELNLTETPEGARDFFVGWFASTPSSCLDFGDESDCGGIGIQIGGATHVTRSAYFRTGRIVGDVSVKATVPTDQEDRSALDEIAGRLARLLFDRIQAQL